MQMKIHCYAHHVEKTCEIVPKQPESETMESQYSSEKPNSQGSTSQNFDIDASIDGVLVSPVRRKQYLYNIELFFFT